MAPPDHAAAARAVYDATADDYVHAIGTRIDPAIEAAVDRALLDAFAELAAAGGGPVADLGCGPGRVAALLAGHGIPAVGLDLAPAMARVARRAHPLLPFGVGELARLPLADGALSGAVCWYSVIHTPPDDLRPVLAEVARVLVVGAPLLVAFQTADDDVVHRADAHGSGLPLTSFRHHVDTVVAALTDAALDVTSTTVRQPAAAHEPTAQAFLLASRR